MKRGPRGIPEQRTRVVRLPREERDQAIGRFRRGNAGELLPDDAVFALERIENHRDAVDRGGRSEETQGVTGRRGVDDHPVVPTAGADPHDFEHREQFVDSGDGQFQQRRDITPIEPRAMLERVTQRAPVVAQPSRERPRGVKFDGVEGAAATSRDRGPPGGQPHVQDIAERMCRIGGDGEHTFPAASRGNRLGSGAGGLADAALPAEEMETER
jgi:hypothetical protein